LAASGGSWRELPSRTRGELTDNLRSALSEALEIRRELTLAAVSKDYEEQTVLV